MRRRENALKLEATQVSSILSSAGVEALNVTEESKLGLVVRVQPDQAISALTAMRDAGLGFTMLMDTFGADIHDAIEVTYHIRSLENDCDMRIKTSLPYGGTYNSVIDVYASVYMPERELAEMFGLVLEGHPNPKRMVTNKHFTTPLLKSVGIRGKEEVWNR